MNTENNCRCRNYLIIAIITSLVGGSVAGIAVQSFLTPAFGIQSTISPKENIIEKQTYVEESDSINAIKKISPAVVSIIASKDLKIYYRNPTPFYFDPFESDPFEQFYQMPSNPSDRPGKQYEIRREQVSGGSGFIISPEGLVLTNKHVISDADADYTIILNDGKEYDGEVISIDPLNDLAVMQIVPKGELEKNKNERTKLNDLPVANLGDSENLQIGQKVLAIGNALGEYQNTVTSGIISAKDREIVAGGGEEGPEALSGLLQTDTAINPGNSGGPLINLAGQVIGVNVAIAQSANGIGFAIPVDDIKPVLQSIQQYGKIVRPTLGVRHTILTKERAEEYKIDIDHGALIVGNEGTKETAIVKDSPADKAGLKENDVILSVDNKDITLDYSLRDAIRERNPGDEITMKVWREGKTMEVKAKLGELEGKTPKKAEKKEIPAEES